MSSVMRIVDANGNRAREALRVMEEAARFILDDAALAGALKSLRHELGAVLGRGTAAEAASVWRDTPGDVGTSIRTDSEGRRASAAEVALAAGKRLSEALRAIEEYAKVLPDGTMARQVEALRYRAYDIERRLNLAMSGGRARQWRLCVLISEILCPGGDWQAVARAAVAGGADCLQLREKSLEAGELLERARWLVTMCREHAVETSGGRAAVIVNDRPDVALLSGADGVHLGQTDLPAAEARGLVGGQLLIGVSTSTLDQAKQAWAEGADYCGVGPMFPTTTKHKDVIVGPDYLRQYVAWGRLPHLAIGGITCDNLPPLLEAGVQGIAVSSTICGSDDPATACRDLLSRFEAVAEESRK